MAGGVGFEPTSARETVGYANHWHHPPMSRNNSNSGIFLKNKSKKKCFLTSANVVLALAFHSYHFILLTTYKYLKLFLKDLLQNRKII